MTWVDLVVLAVLALSALLAFMRGLVREVLGLAAWVGAIFAGVWALPRARPQAQELLGTSPWVDPLTFGVIFIIALIVLMLISRWISALVRASPIGGLDRTLGLVFGLARVRRCWCLPISSPGWWFRWTAGLTSCCRPGHCRWFTRAPVGRCRGCRPTIGRCCTRRHRAVRQPPTLCCTRLHKAGLTANRRFGIRRFLHGRRHDA